MQFEVFEFNRIVDVKYGGIIGLRFAQILWFVVPIWREKCRSYNTRGFMIKSFFHGQNILEISFENVKNTFGVGVLHLQRVSPTFKRHHPLTKGVPHLYKRQTILLYKKGLHST